MIVFHVYAWNQCPRNSERIKQVLSSDFKGQFQKDLESCHPSPAPALSCSTDFIFLHVQVRVGKTTAK